KPASSERAGRIEDRPAPLISGVLQRDAEFRLGLGLDLVERDAVGELDQRHAILAVLVDGEHREVGHDHVDHALAGQRQIALLEQLGAVLRGMLHHDDDALDAGDEVHGATHALHHLAGDHPVGEVAVLRHLHGAEDRQVDMAAAHHAERLGRGEIAGRGQLAHGLLAGVDEVGIDLVLVRERTHAKHAVLALQVHVDAVGDVVRDQRRDADAEIDVIAVAQLLGGAGGHLFTGPGHEALLKRSDLGGGPRTGVAEFDPLLARADLDDAFDEDAGRVDVVRVDLAGRHQMLDLGDGDLRGGRHHRVKVARGLAVDQVAGGVALPGMDDGDVGEQAALHDVLLA
ncbi:hypothetical protein chiPu_0028512, partial [Chiloscyllium punctatum]|nr:hypothetical protein [Chiloscyllium punctatum]